jgi:hypothetical protein
LPLAAQSVKFEQALKQPPAKIKSIIEDLEFFEIVQVDANLIKEYTSAFLLGQHSPGCRQKRPLPYGIDRGHAPRCQIGWPQAPESFSFLALPGVAILVKKISTRLFRKDTRLFALEQSSSFSK